MESHTPQITPTLTLNDLDHIRREVNTACKELAEMVDMRGDLRRVWDTPRKYFVPEIGTWIPFPNEHFWRVVAPVWRLPDPPELLYRSLLEEIVFDIQWFEFARREIIPDRFN